MLTWPVRMDSVPQLSRPAEASLVVLVDFPYLEGMGGFCCQYHILGLAWRA
jgi:hypothetical protein